jgi:hypothetical protein
VNGDLQYYQRLWVVEVELELELDGEKKISACDLTST